MLIAPQIGQMPKLDSWFLKNPLRLWASSKGFINSNTAVVDFARQRIAARPDPEAFDMEKCEGNSSGTIKQRDFLSRFYEAHRKDPDFISKERVLALTVANMAAGSDTTAISLRSVFYHLLRSPADKTKLMKELADAQRSGLLGRNDGLVGWDEVRDLTFLGAVIKEALRCHPAVGLPLERVTPSQGARICGVFVPGGTIVGCSAWAVHQSTAVFGSDANKFRPERWLQASTEQKKIMERSLFSFGAGSRTCIGKNISWLEMYKLVPALLMNFEVRPGPVERPSAYEL
jgi:cytochrome P450